MTGYRITGEETAALSYLPDRLAEEVRRQAALYGGMINEVRLHSGGVMSVTIMGENIPCRVRVTPEECEETFMRLCQSSVYSHAETLRDGFVTTPEGIRAGICGRAVLDDGEVCAIAAPGAISIRIPRRIPGAGDVAYELLCEMQLRRGIISGRRPASERPLFCASLPCGSAAAAAPSVSRLSIHATSLARE